MRLLAGACDCGAVSYAVADEFEYAGSKAPWYEIRDDLPQFDGYPG